MKGTRHGPSKIKRVVLDYSNYGGYIYYFNKVTELTAADPVVLDIQYEEPISIRLIVNFDVFKQSTFVAIHSIKAYCGNGGIALVTHNLTLHWLRSQPHAPAALLQGKYPPIPIKYDNRRNGTERRSRQFA